MPKILNKIVRSDQGYHTLDPCENMKPKHEYQIRHYLEKIDNSINEDGKIQYIVNLVDYINTPENNINIDLPQEFQILFTKNKQYEKSFEDAKKLGKNAKQDRVEHELKEAFSDFLKSDIKRELKQHQVKAALHLLQVENGANFSVPGAGKTTVIVAVYKYLKFKNILDNLVVIGPKSSINPWLNEYYSTVGTKPQAFILTGENREKREDAYMENLSNSSEIYLVNYHILSNDRNKLIHLLNNTKFMLVVDEAHYIKRIGGKFSEAVLELAKFATRRCLLTGTPFPRSYEDAVNYFDVLWPEVKAHNRKVQENIRRLCQSDSQEKACAYLVQAIDPLYYRVRKKDLGLKRQIPHPEIYVDMKDVERYIYDCLRRRISELNEQLDEEDFELSVLLRKGRLIRLRQCVSYPKMLLKKISGMPEYKENLIEGIKDSTLEDKIKNYDTLETPAKFEHLVEKVTDLCNNGKKIVVWSNFILTIKKITAALKKNSVRVDCIYGSTPVYKQSRSVNLSDAKDQQTRAEIIDNFNNHNLQVLVANPAACAESVSLHKQCNNAIYYDLSYNCAQFLQSRERIHRVGGSENRESYYYYLLCKDTIDQTILTNLSKKTQRMTDALNDHIPICSLDMHSPDDDDPLLE